ncbi:sialidase domain-containing protein [Agrilactobacillus yilanensis]|uniref:exo-alpha-sialidase n=1 Tax=Agrilactobacillus yilanensis TaxID=2485997 RepID=A0ABW4J781_9LACO|nr:exo-alpha-sialidase [Agrilactobacillus yilanensis]
MKVKTIRFTFVVLGLMLMVSGLLSSNKASAATEPVYEKNDISLTNSGLDITETLSPLLNGNDQTIIVRFKSDNSNALQALIGLSNNNKGYQNNYFDIYMRNTGELGIELRDSNQAINYQVSRPAALWGKSKGVEHYNTIAFVANSEAKSYTLFANGTKIVEQKVSDFKGINEITGMNAINIGGVNRAGKLAFNFSGEINSLKVYNESLNDQVLESATIESDLPVQIFKANDETGANYFRIPSLYTLNNGRILASADARYGGTHDFLNKINIATSYSDDNGATWATPRLTLAFEDFANEPIEWPRGPGDRDLKISGGATFIDSVMVQSPKDNKVIMMADVMPAGIGFSAANRSDSGYKQINGKYYVKLKKTGETAYNYTIRENGVIYNDTTNEPTTYGVDGHYGLMENGKYLKVEQYSAEFKDGVKHEYHNGTFVNMNIFYKDALFKVVPTNYIAYTTSDDNGTSWSEPTLLPPVMGLDHNAAYLGPGKGTVVSTTGRIIFPAYTGADVVYIYSDDNGLTWAANSVKLPSGWSAEAQIVEINSGVLQSYMRTNNGKVAYMTSTDGGDTWGAPQYLDFINNPGYGTQLSIIKYSQLIDGQEAVILSTPNATNGRRNGQLWTGLIDKANNTINWKYHYDVDYSNYGYSYSAVEELPNHDIGLFYEKFDSWSRNELHMKNVLPYTSLTIDQLLN